MTAILQTRLTYDPLSPRPLPGGAPMEPADWIVVDDAHGPQMAERARLLVHKRAEVVALWPGR